MAIVIEGGAPAADDMAFHRLPQQAYEFFEHSYNSISSKLTDVGRIHMDRVHEIVDRFENSEAMRYAKAAVRKTKSLWQVNAITELLTIAELQNPPRVQMKFLMAEPTIRRAYQQNRLEGYSGLYIDKTPDDHEMDLYEYRCVTDGMVIFDETPDENGDVSWSATSWCEDYEELTDELEFDQKADMLISWTALKKHYEDGKEDPTSRYNASLS